MLLKIKCPNCAYLFTIKVKNFPIFNFDKCKREAEDVKFEVISTSTCTALVPVKRKRGRPKGSKNKIKEDILNEKNS